MQKQQQWQSAASLPEEPGWYYFQPAGKGRGKDKGSGSGKANEEQPRQNLQQPGKSKGKGKGKHNERQQQRQQQTPPVQPGQKTGGPKRVDGQQWVCVECDESHYDYGKKECRTCTCPRRDLHTKNAWEELYPKWLKTQERKLEKTSKAADHYTKDWRTQRNLVSRSLNAFMPLGAEAEQEEGSGNPAEHVPVPEGAGDMDLDGEAAAAAAAVPEKSDKEKKAEYERLQRLSKQLQEVGEDVPQTLSKKLEAARSALPKDDTKLDIAKVLELLKELNDQHKEMQSSCETEKADLDAKISSLQKKREEVVKTQDDEQVAFEKEDRELRKDLSVMLEIKELKPEEPPPPTPTQQEPPPTEAPAAQAPDLKDVSIVDIVNHALTSRSTDPKGMERRLAEITSAMGIYAAVAEKADCKNPIEQATQQLLEALAAASGAQTAAQSSDSNKKQKVVEAEKTD